MHKALFNFILVILAAFFLQACSLKARIKKADKQFEAGEYYAASEKYRNVYRKIDRKEKALKARVAFNQAECYRLLGYSQAESAYLNAIKLNYPDSIIFLRYAQVLQKNGKYNDAVNNYKIYLKKDSTNILGRNGINTLKAVEQLKATQTGYIVKKADALNARRCLSFSPAYAGYEGEALFFTSNRILNTKNAVKNNPVYGLPNNKIYSARKNASGKWEKPVLVSSEATPDATTGTVTETDDGVCGFSPDGKIMYFTRAFKKDGSDLGAGIYYSNRTGGAWSEPKLIPIFQDSTITVAHPAIAPDGETLYFVSDNKTGFGGKDLWKAKLVNGECKDVENMGNQINTLGDEMFPTVRFDGTLYFSSNGHPGMGGLDIFKATPIGKEWLVENMGTPVNSSADDFGMTFEGKKEKGFFSSNRGETKGYDALWSFERPVLEYIVEGKVIDEKSNPIPDAYVKLVSNNGINTKVATKKDGSYRIKIDKNIECIMLATARGYLNKEARLSVPDLKDSKVFKQDILLTTIYKPIQLDNIFYEFGKWNLTAESETGLQELVKTLNDNPNITIEISAHTDFIGNNESNKTLSQKRAQSVVDYLIKAGINPQRLSSVGYGEDKPVVIDSGLAAKYNFVKENDILDETFILKLKPEQQEIANKINRRTEFRVLKTNFR